MVARYAWGRDYHNLVGKRLRKLRRDLRDSGVQSFGGVDTGPILERAWAEVAGLGFTGKNCMQVLPATSSWLFLAVLFVDVEIAPDVPLGDHCGRCTRCLDACPTTAFESPRSLDARRCIAYWTIESKVLPPIKLRSKFGRWFFGCDGCQETCPHNANPPDPEEDDLRPRHAWIDLPQIIKTPDEALLQRFIGTPLRRPGAAGLKRNALITMGNLGHPEAAPAARLALEHDDAVVRGAAVWCLARLGCPPLAGDSDPHPVVEAELHAARSGQVVPADSEPGALPVHR